MPHLLLELRSCPDVALEQASCLAGVQYLAFGWASFPVAHGYRTHLLIGPLDIGLLARLFH